MTLRVRVGRKGYIILPEAVRGAVGIDEGDELIVEVRDGIVLKPVRRRVDADEIRRLLRAHAERLKRLRGRREPEPGEAALVSLEEEFED